MAQPAVAAQPAPAAPAPSLPVPWAVAAPVPIAVALPSPAALSPAALPPAALAAASRNVCLAASRCACVDSVPVLPTRAAVAQPLALHHGSLPFLPAQGATGRRSTAWAHGPVIG